VAAFVDAVVQVVKAGLVAGAELNTTYFRCFGLSGV